jgi:thioredoxin reductase (NADPH)
MQHPDQSVAERDEPSARDRYPGAGPTQDTLTGSDTDPIDCLIVGAGPAGLTAALYLRRFHRRVLVIDSGQSRALQVDRSHNYPGFTEGVAGSELLARIRRQLEDVAGVVLNGEVTSVTARHGGGFSARTESLTVATRTVLLATGVVDCVPDIPGIDEVRRHGLLRQCPICDGHEHSGQRIAVLGEGPHAQAEAVFISHFSRPVTLVAPRGGEHSGGRGEHDRFKAAVSDGRVRHRDSPVVGAMIHEDGSVRLRLSDGTEEAFDVLYAALGCRPRADLAVSLGVDLDESGNLMVDGRCRTSVPGVYAAGDVVAGLDQLTIATGQGATAAIAIHNRGRTPA